MKKKRIKSKTYWFNGSLFALATLVLFSQELKDWIDTLPPEYSALAALFVSVAGMILRELTKEPVS